MSGKIELSIVLPVFNEEKNIPEVIKRFLEISKKVNLEIIFVEDGGSVDNTREIIKKNSLKYDFIKPIFTDERGYGISLYNGLKTAKGEFIGWTHADLQANPLDAIKALKIIEKENFSKNIYIKGKRYGRPLFDVFFTIGMSFFETILLKKSLWDINAQPNIFHRSFLKLMTEPPKDFSFDLYSYYLAKSNGYKIVRFPVYFGKRIYGESSWNTSVSSKIRFIKRTLNFSFKLRKLIGA